MPGSMTHGTIGRRGGGHRARPGLCTLARDNHRHHSYLNPCQTTVRRRIQAAADTAAGRRWQGFLEKTNGRPTDCGLTRLAEAEPVGSQRY